MRKQLSFLGALSHPIALVILAFGVPATASAQVTYGEWGYNKQKDYHYRTCKFPAGGYQYLIYYKSQPEWVYWYNPKGGADAQGAFWCRCPTSKHPTFGADIKQGKDLFQMAEKKARKFEDTTFKADPAREDFKADVKAKDKDESMVQLTCPPDDLP